MDEEARLRERLRKIESLFARTFAEAVHGDTSEAPEAPKALPGIGRR